MARKKIEMRKVTQVLRWYKLGRYSNRKIAEIVGVNKETVNNYVNKAKSDSLSLDELLEMDEYELDIRLRGGTPAYPDSRFETFKELLPYLEEQMNDKNNHVTLYRLWEEYVSEHPGDHYSLTQFRYHYRQHAEAREPVSTILADLYEPGDKLFVDFAGDKLEYVDTATGEIVKVQVFVACLPYSGYTFAMALPSQSTEDFAHAIVQCLNHLGGRPKILVVDNLKAAVIKPDRYAPKLNSVLEDLSNHYKMAVLPARPCRPKDKANVEGTVKILYQRVYAPLRNRVFHSLAELNLAIEELVTKHNRTRMQLHPYTREECFLAMEKGVIKPLPKEEFQVRYATDLKVQHNCCVLLGCDKHYYSVPYHLVGSQVHVDYTRTIVKIYANGELVATHMRDRRPGTYTIEAAHMASNSREWRERSSRYYIDKAFGIMPELAELFTLIFLQGKQAEEVYYRRCDGLLRLQRETEPELFRMACRTALDRERYDYLFVKNIVESGGAGLGKREDVRSPNPTHGNIRGPQAYK